MNLEAQLREGIAALGLSLPAETVEHLLVYLRLLDKWNRTYNLTAVREPDKMVTHHLLDSLSVLPLVSARKVVDVGSGAGLPGIPLALARPGWQVTLIDSNHKKVSFLRQALAELRISNAAVVTERVESWRPVERFDLVISRAFSDLGEFLKLAGHLCVPGGKLAAMKGIYPYEELAQMPDGFRLDRVVPLAVPGLAAERHLVLIQMT